MPPTYTLHRGDALTVLHGLEDRVDAVIVDPPYNSGGRTSAERTGRSARAKYTSGDAQHQLPDFPGENKDQHSYAFWLSLLLAESYRMARPGAMAAVFTDWRQLNATSDAFQAGGWLWRGVAPWHKPQARPQKAQPKQDCEFIIWGSKGPMDRDSNPVYLPGYYRGSQPSGHERVHITQKPIAVMRELVQICVPEGTILDFCAGSGSTGVAALLEGRSFIGIEATPEYAQIANRRLAEAVQSAEATQLPTS
jgi:site-specific DNA-methyltransferase (adenine-specific)